MCFHPYNKSDRPELIIIYYYYRTNVHHFSLTLNRDPRSDENQKASLFDLRWPCKISSRQKPDKVGSDCRENRKLVGLSQRM